MSEVQTLTLSSLLKVIISPHGMYIVAYGWLLGMSIWAFFFAGVIASRNLPRPQFANLQHKTLPTFFILSVILSFFLLVLWTTSHPHVLTHITKPYVTDVAQAYMLAIVFVGQGINYFIIEPIATKTIFKRLQLEKEEGKSSTDPGASDEMKELAKKFKKLHGISALLGLSAVAALVFHGLWIGHEGVRGN